MTLRLDWCSHAAAKYAVEHWHYSRSMPAGKLVMLGVWESGQFVGAVIFARGSNKHIGSRYGLTILQCAELVRVALRERKATTSRIVAIALRMLHRESPGLRLIVSFADPNQGHAGTIYQASNWTYEGHGNENPRCRAYRLPNGSTSHWRTVAGHLSRRGLPSTVDAARTLGYMPLEYMPKHLYLYPLDDAMRAQIAPLAKPYPKRAGSIAVDAPASHAGEGGSIPTSALQSADYARVGRDGE